ncbi:M20 metallopeptidase family protein [Acidaminobacter hydrogenoformans]|uniref:Amidohydrolase n=1 Tax=Acidaminobacter hydrogenoformans DSM 2784 TaxID=1120920 RepID=A0A1G5S0L9_9FIRM|nr:M20 family metallopeptidase [Acidaminobacter hydrogenoformans]SCZ79678.1 amidohydrolase [Acidaminobacter hydrogenoformans DSM 2784]
MNEIMAAAKATEDKIIENRRVLHQNPELGFDLPETAAYIKAQLLEMGIEPQDCGGPVDPEIRTKFRSAGFPDMAACTGVVATIGKGAPCILLRGDMDALPMMETSGLDFASRNNFAHTCGHDSHAAMLLGAARILKARESELKGTVKLMFQPGEELGYGSKLMIDAGLMENPKVDAALAIHVMSDIESGEVQYVKGIASAAMDTFMLKIKGKGGHSSMPHKAVDPNIIMTQLYTALNLLPGREADPQETVILTAGKASGGSVANIIPDTAELQVGVRSFNRQARDHIVSRIPEMIDHYVKAWRGDYELSKFATPSTYNDAAFVEALLPAIKEVAGADQVVEVAKPLPGSEDFSYVSELVPGFFIMLGAGKPGAYPMHNPNMVLDETVFATGAAIYANCAMTWLEVNGA